MLEVVFCYAGGMAVGYDGTSLVWRSWLTFHSPGPVHRYQRPQSTDVMYAACTFGPQCPSAEPGPPTERVPHFPLRGLLGLSPPGGCFLPRRSRQETMCGDCTVVFRAQPVVGIGEKTLSSACIDLWRLNP